MTPMGRRAWTSAAFGLGCWALGAWLFMRDSQAGDFWAREAVNTELALWAGRFLIAALAMSPLSVVLRAPGLKRWRRPLGLAAVGFSIFHTVQYIAYVGVWPDRLPALFTRPFLVLGMGCLALLLPLALTSTRTAVQWLGPTRWKWLHRLVYAAAALMAVHELMALGDPISEPGLHGLLIAGLLAFRAVAGVRAWLIPDGVRRSAAAGQGSSPPGQGGDARAVSHR
jgi:sulfoxide reductase heme-binding subunit YedZ